MITNGHISIRNVSWHFFLIHKIWKQDIARNVEIILFGEGSIEIQSYGARDVSLIDLKTIFFNWPEFTPKFSIIFLCHS